MCPTCSGIFGLRNISNLKPNAVLIYATLHERLNRCGGLYPCTQSPTVFPIPATPPLPPPKREFSAPSSFPVLRLPFPSPLAHVRGCRESLLFMSF
jgi:hypothetical protein